MNTNSNSQLNFGSVHSRVEEMRLHLTRRHFLHNAGRIGIGSAALVSLLGREAVSAPGGILTFIVSVTTVLPLPLHVLQALVTIFPLPLHAGHG